MADTRLEPVVLSQDERRTLENWVRRRSTAQGLAQRARIVLACADGGSNVAVAARLRVDLGSLADCASAEFAWHARSMRPTLYEFAGGERAFGPFATALHARCLADPELNHPFSHADQNPEHVPRLAAYLAEAMGGPPRYTADCGDQTHVVWLHSGNGDMSDLGRRFADCFMLAADDAGWPRDPEFRAAIRDYIDWAVGNVALSHPDDTDIPPGLPLPRWSWDGLRQ